MNIKNKKERMISQLVELESDIANLQENIERARKALIKMSDDTTEEELNAFDEEYDLELGLKHIELF